MTNQKETLVKTHGLTVKIREKCLEAGLMNAYQLQVAAGIAPSVAQNLFNENFSEISLATLEKLLEALNCTAADIFIKEKSLLQTAKEILKDARRVLVLTGAGVSAESGVPTFRGGGGATMWRGMPFEQLSSAQMVEENLPLVWEWFDYRRSVVGECEPNAAHAALSDWQRAGDFDEFTLVTQNVDGLHRRAGSSKILELHGNIWRARCQMCGETFDVRDLPTDERPPVCRMCGDFLRPNVVLFGENLPVKIFETAVERAKACDVCLVVGTSALVYPAASLPEIARQAGAKIIEINPEPTALTETADASLRGKAGEILLSLSGSVISGLSDSDKFVSQTEAARLRGVSRQRIGQLVKSGRLRAIGEGYDALIIVEDLMNLTEGKTGRPRKSEENIIDRKTGETRKSTLAKRMSLDGIQPSDITFPKGFDPKNVPPMTGGNMDITFPDGNQTKTDSKNDSGQRGDAGFFLDEDDEAALDNAWAKVAAEDEETNRVQPENYKELVLDLAAEGGGADIFRQKTENGAWTFLIEVSAMDDEDFDHQPIENVVRTTESIGEAIKLVMNDYQIFILTPLFLHPEHRAEVKAYLENLHRNLTDNERARLQQFAQDSAITPEDWIALADEETKHRAEREAFDWKTNANDSETNINPRGEKLSDKHFLLYWQEMSVLDVMDSGHPLDVISSRQLKRVKAGDTVWIVTVSRVGELILAGKIEVDEIVDYPTAVKLLHDANLWDGGFYALPEAGAAEPMQLINLGDAAFDLRFKSSGANRLKQVGGKINAQQMQSMRELTEESAQLLTKIWEDAREDFDEKDEDYNFPDAEDVRIFEEIVQRNPFDAEAHYNLGVVLSQSSEFEEAIEAYRQAVALSPNYAEAWYNLGADYLQIGNPQKALECFEKAAEAKPDFAQAYFMAGAACDRLNNHKESIRLTEQGLNYAPEDSLAFHNLGNSYERMGNMRQAAEHFEQAAHLAPDFAEALFRAGRCREQTGETGRALELYRQALNVRPDSIEAMFALGALYHKEKYGMDELVESFPTENSLDLQDPRSFFYLGMALLAQDMPGLAYEQIKPLEEMGSPLAGMLREFCRDYGQAIIRENE